MAVDIPAALQILAQIDRDDTSAIELYRADYATPETLEAMRFWAQGELNRIQSGFSSTDEVIKLLTGALRDILSTLDDISSGDDPLGLKGPQGEPGEPGEPGADGRTAVVFEQATDPGANAFPGDFWIKTGYA